MTVIASVAWRGGYTDYNGFYQSTNGGAHWTIVDPQGIDAAHIGRASFAYSAGRNASLRRRGVHQQVLLRTPTPP